MSFLSPLWLLLALLGLLIVLLCTRRTQEDSSLYLWRKIAHDLLPPPLNPLIEREGNNPHLLVEALDPARTWLSRSPRPATQASSFRCTKPPRAATRPALGPENKRS